MLEGQVSCDYAEAQRFATDVLQAVGLPDADARFMGHLIVDSDLAGHESHGLRRLSEYVELWRAGQVNTRPRIAIEGDRGSTVTMLGDNGFGHIVLRDATALAVARAKL